MREITKEEQIKNGDVGLVDSSGFLPDAIHKFQGDRFNHALIFIRIFGKLWVFEAIKQGCAFTSFADYLKRIKDKEIDMVLLRPISDIFDGISEEKYGNFILPLTRKPYGFVNLLFLQSIKFIGRKFGKDWWIGGKNHTRSFICGELVAYIYNHFLGWFPKWYKIAPVKLHLSPKFVHYDIDIKSL